MSNMIRKILEYSTIDNKQPVKDWIKNLDTSIRARVEARLKRIKLGNLGDIKELGSGLGELRLHFGKGYRIYLGFFNAQIIILLCAGDKSSQTNDIKKAHMYFEDFKRRKINE